MRNYFFTFSKNNFDGTFSKIVELEEELRVVGNNLKSLELSEEKALEREETYEEQIRQLDGRLKEVKKYSTESASNLLQNKTVY